MTLREMASRAAEEAAKGPLPRQEWAGDCVTCPERIENEDREAGRGSFIVGALAIFGIGVVIGVGTMVAIWFIAVQK